MSRPAFWLLLGVTAGQLAAGPLTWLYPTGRFWRGTLAMAAAESAWDPSARGPGGEVGILQWLLPDKWRPAPAPDGWRSSPFWSGFAVPRYVMTRPYDQVVATLSMGDRGLVAWRRLWLSGNSLNEAIAPSGSRVGSLARRQWALSGRWTWLVNIAQYFSVIPAVVKLLFSIFAMLGGYRGARDV